MPPITRLHPFIIFSFGCAPFYNTCHSQPGDLHAFARRGIPAAFRFLVGSFSPMQPEQTAIGCLTRSLRPNFPAYPSTQEASVASRLFSYAASIPIRFRRSGDFSRHWQESCRPCDLRCVLPNPMSLCVLLFHKCFWPKSQSFSVAKIVCSRERLMSLDQCPAAQIFLYRAYRFCPGQK